MGAPLCSASCSCLNLGSVSYATRRSAGDGQPLHASSMSCCNLGYNTQRLLSTLGKLDVEQLECCCAIRQGDCGKQSLVACPAALAAQITGGLPLDRCSGRHATSRCHPVIGQLPWRQAGGQQLVAGAPGDVQAAAGRQRHGRQHLGRTAISMLRRQI